MLTLLYYFDEVHEREGYVLAIQGNGKITHEHISFYKISIKYSLFIFQPIQLYFVKSGFFVTSFRTKLWFILVHSKNHDLYMRKRNFEFLLCLKTSLREKAFLSRVFLLSIFGWQLFILNLGQLHFFNTRKMYLWM